MAMEKNKVKFGLNKVHYAKITSYDEEGVPTFAKPVRIPGAVSLSIDAEGEASNFYADDGVYYVINNNSGYTGDLEIALVPLEFATDILGEKLDEKGVLTETNTAEVSQFALLFEFSGDKNKIRHCLFCCSASRPATESSTIEDEKEVKTETLSLTATALNSGLVKTKTCEKTDDEDNENWYKAVYMPNLAAAVQSGKASAASVIAYVGCSMAIQKNITIDGIDVPFKASAAVPRLYRLKFRRDIYQDFAALQKSVGENTEESSALDIESLEVFENIAYIMAKHADAAIPASPDEWLEQFNTFSIYEILPQLIDLWGLNVETQVQSKKNIARLTDR